MSTGAASVLLIGIFRHADEFNRVGVLKKFHFCLPVIELVLIAALMFITCTNSTAGWNSVMSLLVGGYAPLFWIGLVLIGLVLPTALETWLLSSAEGVRGEPQSSLDQRRVRAENTDQCFRDEDDHAPHDGRVAENKETQ